MKKMFKFLFVVALAFVVCACGAPEPNKTIHLASEYDGMQIDVVLECKDDILLKETQTIKTNVNAIIEEYGISKDDYMKELYSFKVTYEEFECFDYDYTLEDETVTEVLVYDYSKPDYIKTLVEEELLELEDGSDTALAMEYQDYVDSMVEEGFEIIE